MMNLTKAAIMSAGLLVSGASFALPVYTGDTTGNPGFPDAENAKASVTESGYYIWNDAADTNSWSIRWTSPTESTAPSWWGNIGVYNGLGEYKEVSFEGVDESDDWAFMGLDVISFEAKTNTLGNYDGVDFTLKDGVSLVDFGLGASFFSWESPAEEIFIGSAMANPEVWIGKSWIREDGMGSGSWKKTYKFSISTDSVAANVPEPGILALYGLGLLGLGLLGRRKANS